MELGWGREGDLGISGGTDSSRGRAPNLTHRLQHSELHLPKLILLDPGLPHDFGAPFPGFLQKTWGGGSRQGWTLRSPCRLPLLDRLGVVLPQPPPVFPGPGRNLPRQLQLLPLIPMLHAHLANRETEAGQGPKLGLWETKQVGVGGLSCLC